MSISHYSVNMPSLQVKEHPSANQTAKYVDSLFSVKSAYGIDAMLIAVNADGYCPGIAIGDAMLDSAGKTRRLTDAKLSPISAPMDDSIGSSSVYSLLQLYITASSMLFNC